MTELKSVEGRKTFHKSEMMKNKRNGRKFKSSYRIVKERSLLCISRQQKEWKRKKKPWRYLHAYESECGNTIWFYAFLLLVVYQHAVRDDGRMLAVMVMVVGGWITLDRLNYTSTRHQCGCWWDVTCEGGEMVESAGEEELETSVMWWRMCTYSWKLKGNSNLNGKELSCSPSFAPVSAICFATHRAKSSSQTAHTVLMLLAVV